MNRIKIISMFIALLLVYACGDPVVEINEVEYEPKIVVEGYLYPGETINEIKLMRNFPLETTIDSTGLFLTPGRNSVSASINDEPLLFNENKNYYYNDNITVQHGTPYTIKVSANLEGNDLYAESETLTPTEGFRIINNDLGIVKYRNEKAMIEFNTSPGTGFYVFSIRAVDASVENFIYDNPFFPGLEPQDVADDFDDFLFQLNLILNINSDNGESIFYEISELDTWFYSNYSVIVYGGDENFKDYLLTVNQVQEPDGNFVEPEFHFRGDGIGIFGSAVKDTVTFMLVP